jgi:hypothetical protein
MAVAIANTTYSASAGGTATSNISTVRASGQGLLIGVFREYTLGSTVDTISSVVWDSAGDNQSFTLIDAQQEFEDAVGMSRYLAVYYLAAPTTAKTANITVTFSGSANHDNVAFIVRHITGHDTSSMIRGSVKDGHKFSSSIPITDTITSAAGDLCVDFMSVRVNTTEFSADSPQADISENATNISSRTLNSSSKAGATSVTMSWTSTNATAFSSAHIVVSVQPGAAASRPNKQLMIGVG